LARARLVARARRELPEPGDPQRLMDDLAAAGCDGSEALEVVARASLAWTQLRDLSLERAWQRGYGWFLARNLMLYGLLVLGLRLVLGVPPAVMDGALAGAALYYVVVLALMPLRVRGHARRRAGILAAYARDLSAWLDALPPSGSGAGAARTPD
jgi:hypothetical protein